MQTKNDWRIQYKEKRKQLSADDIDAKSMKIANKLINEPIWDYSNYHLFLPIKKQKEVNTEYLMSVLQGQDKNIVLSSTDFEKYQMKHYLLTDDTLIKENNMGIPEPTNGFEVNNNQIDVVFVPLLAFDTYGHRIGYGKGFYDRFLSHCKKEVLKIGLSFFEAENQIPADDYDIKLDGCQTPENMYWFNT